MIESPPQSELAQQITAEVAAAPTWIWSVVVDDALYVRAYNGHSSRWYQAAMRQKARRISAAGMTEDVTFERVDGAVNDRIDDAYRAKYKTSPYLSPMIGNRALHYSEGDPARHRLT
jgi:hypothetical protein